MRIRCGLSVVGIPGLCLLLFLPMACGPEKSPGPSAPLSLCYQHSILGLDPHAQNDGVTGAVLSAVFQPLVEVRPGVGIRPILARNWITPRPDLWRFEIRKGVYFHNGHLLEPEDVVFSLTRARKEGMSTYLEAIGSVERAADGWVEVTTRGPYPLLLSRLAMVGIVPRGYTPEKPCGTGPYQWVSGERVGSIEIRRWEKFWDIKPDVDRIRISFVPDDEAMYQAISAGKVDVVGKTGVDFLLCHPLSTLPGHWTIVQNPASATTMLGLNVNVPALSDPRVRLAIDLVIDREKLVQKAMPPGMGRVATGLVPEEVFGAIPNLPVLQPDLGRARKLVREAGLEAGTILHLAHSRVSLPIVEEIGRRLEMLGFSVEVEDQPFDVFYRRMEEESLEAFLFGWNFDLGDASDFLDAMVHSRGNEALGKLNGSGFSDPLVDHWIEAAGREISEEKRLGELRSVLATIQRELPYIPLFYSIRLAMFHKPFGMEARAGSWLRPYEITVSE